jgi:hypothetical protein
MNIERYPAGRILLPKTMLTEEEQREVIQNIWKFTPEIIRDIVCENCPEHCGKLP